MRKNIRIYVDQKIEGGIILLNKKSYIRPAKHLNKSEYVLRPDFINTLRLFN